MKQLMLVRADNGYSLQDYHSKRQFLYVFPTVEKLCAWLREFDKRTAPRVKRRRKA